MPRKVHAHRMRTYHALSLDLWFTTLYFVVEDEAAWREDRLGVLEAGLRDGEDRPIARDRLARATDVVRAEMRRRGREWDTTDPADLVRAVARELDGHWAGELDALASAYSAAGLMRRPPRLAEGVLEVGRALSAQGIPLVAVTNTARRESSWRALFDHLGGPPFRHIVTSCEIGRKKPDPHLFLEAARRLELDPSEILHVGDRWELDVDGAQRAGCGAVVFRGLWGRYPAAGYTEGTLPPNDGPGGPDADDVPRIDRLEELLNASRFSFAPR